MKRMGNFKGRCRRLHAAVTGVLLSAITAIGVAQDASPAVKVLQLRHDFYMLTVDDINIGLQVGPDGALLVNSGPERDAAALLQTVHSLSSQPIRFLINTNADPELTGANARLSLAGESMMVAFAYVTRFGNDIDKIPATPEGLIIRRAPIIAREGILEQMAVTPAAQQSSFALPSEVFSRPQMNMRFNGDIINVVALPPAHSSADSAVLFRRADVVITGAVFDITHFPVIDLQNGGSIDGEIAAVNQIMNTLAVPTVPAVNNDDGTLVVPLHGPVCNQPDLWSYRDMLLAVRSRVQYLIDHGAKLKQVEAADPTQGYRRRYGSDSGNWTTQDFVAAVYSSLVTARNTNGKKKGAR